MVSAEYPEMHTPYQPTTVDLDGESRVHFDGSYFLDPRGIVRLGEIVVAFVGYCIILASHLNIYLVGEYLCGVSIAGMFISAAFLGIYLFHIVEAYHHIPWLKIELGVNALLSAFYVAAAVLTTYVATHMGDFISLAVISLIQVILYGADTFISFSLVKTRTPPMISTPLTYQRAPSVPA